MPEPKNPKFLKPPVVETALAVQFAPLEQLRVTHFGQFWQQIKNDFPTVQEKAALPPTIEVPGKRVQILIPPIAKWKITEAYELPRVWFKGVAGAQGEQLIQIQSDRFIQNWRRTDLASQEYPRYHHNRGAFMQAFTQFQDFIKAENIGPITVNLCEVTYVNHIPLLDGGDVAKTITSVFPSLSLLKSDHFLPPEQIVIMNTAFPMPESLGRLHVSIQCPVAPEGQDEVLDFRLTARGAPPSPDMDAVMGWLDIGHDWVVQGFRSLTSPQMHALWEVQI